MLGWAFTPVLLRAITLPGSGSSRSSNPGKLHLFFKVFFQGPMSRKTLKTRRAEKTIFWRSIVGMSICGPHVHCDSEFTIFLATPRGHISSRVLPCAALGVHQHCVVADFDRHVARVLDLTLLEFTFRISRIEHRFQEFANRLSSSYGNSIGWQHDRVVPIKEKRSLQIPRVEGFGP